MQPSPKLRSIRTSRDVKSFYLDDDFSLPQLGICSTCNLTDKHCSCCFEPHSGTTNDVNIYKISNRTDYENVQFSDQHDPYIYDMDNTVDPTRKLQDANDATLEHFFSRPLKIAEFEWGTGTSLSQNIDPWTLYWENPRVANRIANFNLLRCNMRIKVIINGNGFQYGRILTAYQPLSDFDALSTNSSLISSDLVGTSQLPRIFLDPTTSSGGEMKLPFFWHENSLEIPNNRWNRMGQLLFRTINPLKHANGASDVVTISVFAWAEDVSMSVLTSVETSTLDPQSGEEFEPHSGEIEEANKTGMISGPATALSRMASYLTKIPYVGPFAMATQIAADATASIAKMFGYCRPAVTKNPEPYRPTVCSSLALTNAPDTALRLTVDDKQELTIDPRIAGIGGVDPMNIREIAKRESYLTKFTWAIGTAPETLLWNARVSPVTWAEDSGPPTSFHFPACAFAALPFQFWTGTMRFRFQIVASTFHKGRLKFVYDPNYLATNEYNTNYLRVVDIAEEQDFTIEVGIGQQQNLLEHHYPGVDSVTQMYSTTAYASKEVGNGVLGVYIVNELTTPNSTVNNDIEINVYVSMGDDFEVFAPEDHFQKFVFKPQSGDEIDGFEPHMGSELVPDGQNTAEPSAPQQEDSQIVGMGESVNENVNKVFTGEAITSFRTMLKRYTLWNAIAALDTIDIITYGRFPGFPYLRGNVAGAVDSATGPVPYNFCNTVLLHWVRNAFQGYRGSIRYKFMPRGGQQRSDHIAIQRAPMKGMQLDGTGAPAYDFTQITKPTFSTISDARQYAVTATGVNGLPTNDAPLQGYNGQAITFNHINGCMEFEVPFYSSTRFVPGKEENLTQSFSYGVQPWDYRVEFNGNATSVIDLHVASGEDFQVYFFTGLPRMYYEATPPAAA